MAWRNLNKKYVVRVQLLKLPLEFVVEQGEVVIGCGEEIEEPIYCLMLPMLLFSLAIIRTHHHRRNLSHRVTEPLTLYSSLFSSGGPFKWPRRAGGIA